MLAINEFQEFLSFYPTHPRADYAQYKLGMAHFRQMRAPQRDQTETREAIREFETFVTRYPNSALMPEVKAKLREAQDRLSEVGVRGRRLLLPHPLVSGRDRSAEHAAQGRPGVHRARRRLLLPRRVAGQDQAARPRRFPYFERLVNEFEQSRVLVEARKRIDEMKNRAGTSGDRRRRADRPAFVRHVLARRQRCRTTRAE